MLPFCVPLSRPMCTLHRPQSPLVIRPIIINLAWHKQRTLQNSIFLAGTTHFTCTNASLHVPQVASVPQASDSSWCSHITTYTTTSHSGASYRPLTTSSRPSTARPATPRAAHHGSHPRPASAQDHTGRLAAGDTSPHSPVSSVAAAAAVLRIDTGHLHVTQLVQSKGQQQSGFRSVSPISGGSTGATLSPAQTPCSVLSRPTTAGQHSLLLA